MPTIAEQLEQRRIEKGRKTSGMAETLGVGEKVPQSFAERLLTRRQERAQAGAEERLGGSALMLPEQERAQPLTLLERGEMSLMADTPEERQAAFSRMTGGEGVLTTQVGTEKGPGREIFQRAPGEPTGFVDPTLEEAGPTAGLKTAEMARDVADLAGELPSLALEGVAALATRGAGLARRVLLTAFGGGAGEVARQTGQEVAGTQRESLNQIGQRALIAMGAGAGGELVGSGLVAGRNLVSERGFLAIPEEARREVLAFKELGLESPAAFQVSRNPLMRGLGSQLSQTTPSVANLLDRQRSGLLAAARGASDPKERSRLMERGADLVIKSSDEIEKLALKRETRLGVGGSGTSQGIEIWEDTARAEIGDLYDWAREIEEPPFNLAAVKQAAEEAKIGGLVAQQGGDPARVGAVEKQFDDLLDTIINMPDEIQPVSVPMKDGTTQVISPTEQMRNAMRGLHDFVVIGPTEKRTLQHRDAARVFGALKDEFAGAAERSGNPEFAKRWSKANKANERFMTTRERLASVKKASLENPTMLMHDIGRPNNLDRIVLVRKALNEAGPEGQAKWAKVQDAFVSNLIDPRTPGSVLARINQFDKETLNVFLAREGKGPVREQVRQLKQTAAAVDQLRSVDFVKAQQQDQSIQTFLSNTLQTNNFDQINGLATLVKEAGGKDSPFGTSLRAGMMEFIVNNSRVISEEGVERVDPKAVTKTLRALGQMKALRFLKPEDLRFFNNAKRAAKVVNLMSDVGTSLQRQSIVSGLARFSLNSVGHLARNVGIGRALLSPPARALIGGGTKVRDERLTLRLLGLAATDVALSQAEADKLEISTSQLRDIATGTPMTQEEIDLPAALP